jgi:glycosyltransferase involved in cell wall biosynthesis
MNIVHIAPCFVDIYEETGGVANIIRQICLFLDSNRVRTTLLCSNTELGKKVAQPGILKYSDFLTIYIIEQNKNPLLGPKKELIEILRTIKNPSLVHIHTCFSTITDISLKYFTNLGTKCIFTPHGKLTPFLLKNKYLFKVLYFNIYLKKYLNLVKRIVVSSSNEIEYAKNINLEGPFSFIYNGFSNEIINLSNDDRLEMSYFLYLGYLEPRKQPDLLIKAFINSKAFDIYNLILAGPDSYGFRDELITMVKNAGVEDKVIFIDRIVGMEKFKLLSNAKALLLPSKGEGWPVVIAEAIGNETPLVISKECNFSEINNLGIGLEVSDFKMQSWSAAIDEVAFDLTKYDEYCLNLIKHKTRFTWDYISKQWLDLYIRTINDAKSE